jgi:hypothetical protein
MTNLITTAKGNGNGNGEKQKATAKVTGNGEKQVPSLCCGMTRLKEAGPFALLRDDNSKTTFYELSSLLFLCGLPRLIELL